MIKRIRAADCRTMAWKNGGGSTTEIAVSPPTAGLDAFDWRLSRAQVATGGPFSVFPGIDRTLAILEGEGMALAIDGRDPVTLTLESPQISFPGDAAIDAVLIGGAVEDLNIMTRRARHRHRMQRWTVEGRLRVPIGAATFLIHGWQGGIEVETADGVSGLDAADTLLAEAALPGEVTVWAPAGAVFFLIEIW